MLELGKIQTKQQGLSKYTMVSLQGRGHFSLGKMTWGEMVKDYEISNDKESRDRAWLFSVSS